MRIVGKIDAQGFFLEDVILEDGEPLPADCIESRPLEWFHKPRWDGAELRWVEGLTAAERLQMAKDAKHAELLGHGERAYWAAFSGVGVPAMDRDYVLGILPASGVALSPAQARQVADARAAVEGLRTKLAALEAATTEAEVGAVSWT